MGNRRETDPLDDFRSAFSPSKSARSEPIHPCTSGRRGPPGLLPDILTLRGWIAKTGLEGSSLSNPGQARRDYLDALRTADSLFNNAALHEFARF